MELTQGGSGELVHRQNRRMRGESHHSRRRLSVFLDRMRGLLRINRSQRFNDELRVQLLLMCVSPYRQRSRLWQEICVSPTVNGGDGTTFNVHSAN